MSECDEIAKGIVNEVLPCRCESCDRDRQAFVSRIATALLAEREKVAAKFAAFVDEKGEPWKVLGTLPVTADGVVAMPGQKVYDCWGCPHTVDPSVRDDRKNTTEPLETYWYATQWHRDEGHACALSDCYSTREAAAEAAKEKKS